MFDLTNLQSFRDHQPLGLDNAISRGKGKKLGHADRTPLPTQGDQKNLDFYSSARKLLNDRVISALNDVLVDPQLPIRDLDPKEFTPQAVAERILNFVGEAIENRRGESPDVASNMLEQARVGIEKGFNDAKEMLQNLGIYRGDIQAGAETTYGLLQDGMDDFSQKIAEGISLRPEGNSSLVQMAGSTASYAERQSTELKIKTRDGDIVTIHVEKNNDYSRSEAAYNDGNTQAYAFEESISASKGLSYTVEGDLDEDERAAINDLVGEVKGLSDTFFNGDTQAAFHHALDIGYDSSEIASYSLSLSHTQTSVATQAYSEIREYDQGAKHLPQGQLNNLFSPLTDMMKQMEHMLGQARALFDQHDGQQDIKKLFDELSLMDNKNHPAINHLEDHAGIPFRELTQPFFG